MNPSSTTRVDLHCHSTASAVSKLGVSRSLGLPECATPPEEVYALAKARGMDFVTITDHDTIDGAAEIAARHEDAFVSEELTAWFKGERQAVHILCFGITPDDHAALQSLRRDVEAVATYLHEHEIACALAHPFYAVAAPLTAGHRRRLAELFDVWEVRNGSRAPELNAPAAVYLDTHGGTGVAGSDDHAGVDIGRTYTETPPAATWQEFLGHVRGGRTADRGDEGSAEKWAHAAMAIAVRALGRGDGDAAPDPAVVLRMVERVMAEGNARKGAIGADLRPDDARALLRAWLAAVDLDLTDAELLAWMQSDSFSHAALFRRARRGHERRLGAAIDELAGTPAVADLPAGMARLFGACIGAVPYAPAAAFLGREKAKLARRAGDRRRVALVADGVGAMHGVTHTLDELRERGVPGFDVEVVGTDPSVDRRLPAVRDVAIPYCGELTLGVPAIPDVVEVLAEGRYDAIHLVSPGPVGAVAAVVARILELPVVGSYHTELAAYAGVRTRDPAADAVVRQALAAFYGGCSHVLSPSAASDDALAALGVPAERIGRWDRGVDAARFTPAKRDSAWLPVCGHRTTVLHAGRLTREKGADLLADAFLRARERDPRLHLVLAGGGPEEGMLRERLGDHATFLGWLAGDDLARAYASADAFLFTSRTDTFGQVLLEAQASGLPVVAVDEGGPRSIVRHMATGLLCPPERDALAAAVCRLSASAALRTRLAEGAREEVLSRTWEASLERLAAGYRTALGAPSSRPAEADREVVVAA